MGQLIIRNSIEDEDSKRDSLGAESGEKEEEEDGTAKDEEKKETEDSSITEDAKDSTEDAKDSTEEAKSSTEEAKNSTEEAKDEKRDSEANDVVAVPEAEGSGEKEEEPEVAPPAQVIGKAEKEEEDEEEEDVPIMPLPQRPKSVWDELEEEDRKKAESLVAGKFSSGSDSDDADALRTECCINEDDLEPFEDLLILVRSAAAMHKVFASFARQFGLGYGRSVLMDHRHYTEVSRAEESQLFANKAVRLGDLRNIHYRDIIWYEAFGSETAPKPGTTQQQAEQPAPEGGRKMERGATQRLSSEKTEKTEQPVDARLSVGDESETAPQQQNEEAETQQTGSGEKGTSSKKLESSPGAGAQQTQEPFGVPRSSLPSAAAQAQSPNFLTNWGREIGLLTPLGKQTIQQMKLSATADEGKDPFLVSLCPERVVRNLLPRNPVQEALHKSWMFRREPCRDFLEFYFQDSVSVPLFEEFIGKTLELLENSGEKRKFFSAETWKLVQTLTRSEVNANLTTAMRELKIARETTVMAAESQQAEDDNSQHNNRASVKQTFDDATTGPVDIRVEKSRKQLLQRKRNEERKTAEKAFIANSLEQLLRPPPNTPSSERQIKMVDVIREEEERRRVWIERHAQHAPFWLYEPVNVAAGGRQFGGLIPSSNISGFASEFEGNGIPDPAAVPAGVSSTMTAGSPLFSRVDDIGSSNAEEENRQDWAALLKREKEREEAVAPHFVNLDRSAENILKDRKKARAEEDFRLWKSRMPPDSDDSDLLSDDEDSEDEELLIDSAILGLVTPGRRKSSGRRSTGRSSTGIKSMNFQRMSLNESAHSGAAGIAAFHAMLANSASGRALRPPKTFYRSRENVWLEAYLKIQGVRAKIATTKSALQDGMRRLNEANERIRSIETSLIHLERDREMAGTKLHELEQSANFQAQRAAAAKQNMQNDLNAAVVVLNEAIATLSRLTQGEMSELALMEPPVPKGVSLIAQALCLMFKIKPLKSWNATLQTFQMDYWEPARQHVLIDRDILKKMIAFDKESLSDESIGALVRICEDPVFERMKLNTIAVSAGAIGYWVQAVLGHLAALKLVAQRRGDLQAMEHELRSNLVNLGAARRELEKISQNHTNLNTNLATEIADQEAVRGVTNQCNAVLERTSKFNLSFSKEYEARVYKLAQQYINLERCRLGNALLGAFVLTYLGLFPKELRGLIMQQLFTDELLGGIKVKLRYFYDNQNEKSEHVLGLNFSKEYDLASVLWNGDIRNQRHWHIRGNLPLSNVESGIILDESRCRWPLLIDPHGFALRWLRHCLSVLLLINWLCVAALDIDVNFVLL